MVERETEEEKQDSIYHISLRWSYKLVTIPKTTSKTITFWKTLQSIYFTDGSASKLWQDLLQMLKETFTYNKMFHTNKTKTLFTNKLTVSFWQTIHHDKHRVTHFVLIHWNMKLKSRNFIVSHWFYFSVQYDRVHIRYIKLPHHKTYYFNVNEVGYVIQTSLL
jgi:hypothetical protein